MLRVFNAREGFDRKDDNLPKKLFKGLRGGATDGVRLSEEEIENAKDLYYIMSGWDVETGTPTRAKLEALGIGWAADQTSI
jgi:aldehyde:ferredoxin oxidoreductase